MSATTIEQAARMSDMTAEVVVVEALETDPRAYSDEVLRHAERVARAAYVDVVSTTVLVGHHRRCRRGSREWLNTAWQAARKRAQAALFVHRAATWDSIGSDAPVITRDQDELRVLREAMVGHPDVVAPVRRVPEVSLVAVSVLREQLDDVETSLVARARDDGVLAPYRPAARATAARSGRRTLRRTSRRWTRPRTT